MIYFTSTNEYQLNYDLYVPRALMTARQTILCWPMYATDTALDNYIQQTYNMSLKAACLVILSNLQPNYVSKATVVFKVKNEKLAELARLICFGNGNLIGSKILKAALA